MRWVMGLLKQRFCKDKKRKTESYKCVSQVPREFLNKFCFKLLVWLSVWLGILGLISVIDLQKMLFFEFDISVR